MDNFWIRFDIMLSQSFFIAKRPIEFVASYGGSTLSGGATSVTFTGQSLGDFLIAFGGTQSLGDPSFTSGWAKIISYAATAAASRAGILVYKFADTTSNDTLTFTGIGSSGLAYSGGLRFKNVRGIGATNTYLQPTGQAADNTVPTPSLTCSDASSRSAVVAATFFAAASVSGIANLAAGMAYELNVVSKAQNNTGFAPPSGTAVNISGIVELLY